MAEVDLHELYQSIILDHNKRPRNCGTLAEATHRGKGYNPLCGDEIEVFLKVVDDRVVEISFQAAACAICKASASLMTVEVEGATLDEADAAWERAERLLKGSGMAELDTDGELAALAGVSKFPARVKCATLPWQTYRAALRGDPTAVTE